MIRPFKAVIITCVALTAASCSVSRNIPSGYSQLGPEYRSFRGTLESVTYPTSIPGPKERRMYVYLPEGYCGSDSRYPVLYMLHGARGDETDWIRQGKILPAIDSLMQSGSIVPMIVVFPNMNSYDSEEDYAYSRHKGALESFFEVDGAVETSFVKDVTGAVDSIFRTVPTKNGRAIAGLSLGGMQALYISASFHDTFAYVGILSAPLHSALRKGPYSSFYDYVESKVVNQFVTPPFTYNIYVGEKDIYKSTMDKYSKWLDSRDYECKFFLDKGGHQWPQWLSFATGFMKELFR